MSAQGEPDSAWQHLAQAQSLLDIGRHRDAARYAQQALSRDPANIHAYCLLVVAFLGAEETRLALDAADHAVALRPDFETPHRLRSLILLNLKKKRPALAAALESVRLAPDSPHGLVALAEAELANRHRDAAQRAAQRLLSLAPEWPTAHATLGRVATARRRWKEAEGHYRQALALDPRDWQALHNLGIVLSRQRRRKEAMECLRDAARLQPSNPLGRKNLDVELERHLSMYHRSAPGASLLLLFIIVFPGVAFVIGVMELIHNLVARPFKLRRLDPTLAEFYRSQQRLKRQAHRKRQLFVLKGMLLGTVVVVLLLVILVGLPSLMR